MAGIARAMGANLWGAQNCLAKIKICDLQFFNLYFAPHTRINCNPASTLPSYLMDEVGRAAPAPPSIMI